MSMSYEFNLKILTKKVLLSFAIDISAIEYSRSGFKIAMLIGCY